MTYTPSSTGAAGVIELDELRHDAKNGIGRPPINVTAAPYHIIPDGSTDLTAALQRVFNDAISQGRSVYFPGAPNPYTIAGTITLNGQVDFYGDGEKATCIRALRLNAPMFALNVNITNWEASSYHDIRFDAFFQSGDGYNLSCVFGIAGDGVAYFQHNRFERLTAAGFYDGPMRVTKTTHQTGSGAATLNEALVCWNAFDKIRVCGFVNPCYQGFNFTLGSGTGNHWSGLTGNPTSQFINFDGNNASVGDIVVNTSHFAGNGQTFIVRIGDNTTYRNNVSVTSSQVDAGAYNPFSLSTVGGTEYSNFKYNGCNTGGGATTTGIPAVRGLVIESRGVGRQEHGKLFTNLNGGNQTLTLFSVTVGTAEFVKVDFVVTAVLQGVSVGGGIETWIVRNDGSNTTATRVISTYLPSTPGYTLAGNINGATVGFTCAISPTAAGSEVEVQMATRGGKHSSGIL